MNHYIIPAALLVAILITLFFALFTKRQFRGLRIFFLILFLVSWTGQLWIAPFGPVILGVSWLPLIMIAVFFAVFVFALVPPLPATGKEDDAFIALGTFFWIILLLLLFSIAVGYYRSPPPMGVT